MNLNFMSLERGVYSDWISKWRNWQYAWCEDTEPVVDFEMRIIVKNKELSLNDMGEISSGISNSIGRARLNKAGEILIRTTSSCEPMLTVKKCADKDEFGIVTLRLSLFSRVNILKTALILEKLGHGVIHGDVFHDDKKSIKYIRKNVMPLRDDPVWDTVESGLWL